MTSLRIGVLAVALLGSPAMAGDLKLDDEIAATHQALQKATEELGCLVTLGGSHQSELSRILDMLTDGEVELRKARRLAQAASSAEERSRALAHARQSRAMIDLANDYRLQSGMN